MIISESKKKIANKVLKHEWIPVVVGKLGAEGVTKKNYDSGKARIILSKCIMPRFLVETLAKYESEIKERLQ